MITIIQEHPSRDGNVRHNVIANVTDLGKADNQVIRNAKKPQAVIWCTIPGMSKYPIAFFPCSQRRDAAYEYIRGSTSKTVLLEWNTFFSLPEIDPKTLRVKILNSGYTLPKTLLHSISRIETTLGGTDAFSSLPRGYIGALKLGAGFRVINPNIRLVWAKTLSLPRRLVDLQVSRSQVFGELINLNNETFNNSAASYDNNFVV